MISLFFDHTLHNAQCVSVNNVTSTHLPVFLIRLNMDQQQSGHLEPVLDEIKYHFPSVNIIHFFSNGPISQYRQQLKFYIFAKVVSERKFELEI